MICGRRVRHHFSIGCIRREKYYETEKIVLLYHNFYWFTISLGDMGSFLVCIVPQTRVRFRNFEAFRDKAENSGLSMSLPDSQDDLKYYYHVEWFQYLSGFSVSLSDNDYKQMIESCIEEYQYYNNSYEFVKYFYQYNEREIQYAQEDVLEKNGIIFFECLML